MIRDALVRLVLRNWLILGLEKAKGYFGNFIVIWSFREFGNSIKKIGDIL